MPSGEPPAVRSRDRVAVVQKRRCRRLAAAGRRRMVLAPETGVSRSYVRPRSSPRPGRQSVPHFALGFVTAPSSGVGSLPGVRYGWAVERGCHTGESELARPFRGTLRVPFGRRRSDRPLKLPRHRDELAQRVLEIGKVWCLQEGPIERS